MSYGPRYRDVAVDPSPPQGPVTVPAGTEDALRPRPPGRGILSRATSWVMERFYPSPNFDDWPDIVATNAGGDVLRIPVDPTGKTDCGPAIQAAIDHATAPSRFENIPPSPSQFRPVAAVEVEAGPALDELQRRVDEFDLKHPRLLPPRPSAPK